MAIPSASDWVEQAILYASLHSWSLIPLVSRRKVASGQTGMSPPEPHFQPWKDEYASDEPTIRSWGDVVEQADIGLVTGAPSSVIVLEIRVESGGRETLDELCPEGQHLPDTVCFSDYNRDAWLIFEHPGFPVASTDIGPGLTLHGEENIVRLPQSQYLRASGGLAWDAAPGLDAIAELPGWFWRVIGIDVRTRTDVDENGRALEGRAMLPFESGTAALDHEHRPHWIARPWAAAGSLLLLLGAAKRAGKSTWLRHLAHAVVSGEAFLGEETLASPVLFLTEESRPIVGQALEGMDLKNDLAADRLHVLYHTDVSELSWEQVVEACIIQSTETGARLVIIDTLNRFTPEQAISRLSRESLRGIERMTREGLAVVAAVHHPTVSDNSAGEAALQALGPIVSVSDTVAHLRCLPRAAKTQRRLDVWSRFREAAGLFLQLTAEGYRPLRRAEATALPSDQAGDGNGQLTLNPSVSGQSS